MANHIDSGLYLPCRVKKFIPIVGAPAVSPHLFNVSDTSYILPNGRMYKVLVMANFKALSEHLPEGTKKNQETLQ